MTKLTGRSSRDEGECLAAACLSLIKCKIGSWVASSSSKVLLASTYLTRYSQYAFQNDAVNKSPAAKRYTFEYQKEKKRRVQYTKIYRPCADRSLRETDYDLFYSRLGSNLFERSRLKRGPALEMPLTD